MVIPKPIREAAGLVPGQELQAQYRDGAIVVEPAPRKVKLVRQGSLLVAFAPAGENPLTHAEVAKVIRESRAERDRH
jgi:bifunctional DNA-binding transcriptional regulator/antitoxin component of YhaV-PrlF toxin-antitoxin module